MSGIGRSAALLYVAAMGMIPIGAMAGAYWLGTDGADTGLAILYTLALGLVQFLSWAWMLVKISGRWTPGRGAVPSNSGKPKEKERCR